MAPCFIRQHHSYLTVAGIFIRAELSREDLALRGQRHHRSCNSTWKLPHQLAHLWAMTKVNICFRTLPISSLSFIPTTSSWIIMRSHMLGCICSVIVRKISLNHAFHQIRTARFSSFLKPVLSRHGNEFWCTGPRSSAMIGSLPSCFFSPLNGSKFRPLIHLLSVAFAAP